MYLGRYLSMYMYLLFTDLLVSTYQNPGALVVPASSSTDQQARASLPADLESDLQRPFGGRTISSDRYNFIKLEYQPTSVIVHYSSVMYALLRIIHRVPGVAGCCAYS